MLLVLLAVLALILMWPVRVEFDLRLDITRGADGKLRLRFLSGLFVLRYMLEINPDHLRRFIVFYREGEDENVVYRPGRAEKPRDVGWLTLPIRRIWGHVRVKKLCITGTLGIGHDAFHTAMLAGAVGVALQSCALVALQNGNPAVARVYIAPAFNQSCFRINLESITAANPIHIITAIIIYGRRNRKGKRAAWRILSKTS
jgi:hypothetical protein